MLASTTWLPKYLLVWKLHNAQSCFRSSFRSSFSNLNPPMRLQRVYRRSDNNPHLKLLHGGARQAVGDRNAPWWLSR